MTRFRVRRYHGKVLVKTYGVFDDRDFAEWLALRAAEKHPAHVVEVAPVEVP